MFKYLILAAILGLTVAQNVWWPFSYSECSFGTGGLSVKINDLWVDAPIYHPGFHNFRVSAELIRAVNSRVNGTVVMYRTVSGLRAPVTCTIITIDPQTVLSIGSCTYPDLCDLLYTLLGVKDSPECPEWLVEEGFTCKCPWDFAAGRSVNLEEEIEVTDLSQYGVAWLVSGNFEVNVKASHGTQPAICLDIKAGVSQRPGGK